MLNLRDPTFISAASERNNTLENTTTHLDLTFVESHNPTQLSDRDGFVESEIREGDETRTADLCPHHHHQHYHRPSGKHLISFVLPFL